MNIRDVHDVLPGGTYKISGTIRVGAGENVLDALAEAVLVCPITNKPHRWHRDGISAQWLCADCWAEDANG